MTFLLQEFFRKSDLNNSGDVDKAEFVNYLREHEQQLHIVFSSLDENQDGKKLCSDSFKGLAGSVGLFLRRIPMAKKSDSREY